MGDVHFALLSGPSRIIFNVFGVFKSIVFPSSSVWESKLVQGFPAAELSQRAA